jgi:hypothetical protein
MTTTSTATKTVKVTVSYTLEVDQEAWEMSYGAAGSVQALREDVRNYFLNEIQCGATADYCVTNIARKL